MCIDLPDLTLLRKELIVIVEVIAYCVLLGRCVTHSYETSAFRFQVMDGVLWVDHFPWSKYPDGVVPEALTPWDTTNW